VSQKVYQLETGGNSSANKGDQLPVESVTWKDAMKYCGLIGGYLPTEAEWEYAARAHAGITPARYGSLDSVAWHSGNSGGTTHPVAKKQPNASGLYDMLGNVWEWVLDVYSETESILRGGASDVNAWNVRASRRTPIAWSASFPAGFRCAGDWPVPEKVPPNGSVGAAPSQVSPGVYRFGNGVSAPALLRKVEPQYSEKARQAKLMGTVLLYIQIDPSGKAINIRVLHSLGMGLDEKAIEAVKRWKFRPGFKDGKPVTVESQVEVNFRLL
jgi:TonB family protein